MWTWPEHISLHTTVRMQASQQRPRQSFLGCSLPYTQLLYPPNIHENESVIAPTLWWTRFLLTPVQHHLPQSQCYPPWRPPALRCLWFWVFYCWDRMCPRLEAGAEWIHNLGRSDDLTWKAGGWPASSSFFLCWQTLRYLLSLKTGGFCISIKYFESSALNTNCDYVW